MPWQKQQERNLCYVAATRAKKELVLIEEKQKNAKLPRGGAQEFVGDVFAGDEA